MSFKELFLLKKKKKTALRFIIPLPVHGGRKCCGFTYLTNEADGVADGIDSPE